ncbi:non-heme iron oxygenase ferredoxin subunit [Burkholderia cenocepacia]|nr:non-heme iron oxygenase ferredoxin subunit [Burkholderia cenocepacia]
MTEHWIRVIETDAVPQDDVIGVSVEGRQLAVAKVGDTVYAVDNICTHGNARLCDGFLDGYELECPLHQGKFDIRTGKALCEPLTEDSVAYPIKLEGGFVLVRI